MSKYLTTKPIFDTTKVKVGNFIEVFSINNPLQEVRRGVIIYASETSVQLMDGRTHKFTVNPDQIAASELEIRVAERLDDFMNYHGIGTIIKHIKTESHPHAGRRMNIELHDDLKERDATYNEVIIDNKSYIPYDPRKDFVTEVITKVSIENIDENEERTLYIDTHKNYSQPFDRIKLNGIPYFPVFRDKTVRTNHIALHNDQSPMESAYPSKEEMVKFVQATKGLNVDETI